MVDYVFERHLSGGILLAANKTGSTVSPIRRGFVPKTLVLALRQHRGNPAEPVVAVGEHVRKYQTVALAAGAPSAAVHAGTSGWVRAIDERPVLGGNGVQPSPCIVIEADGRDESIGADSLPHWPAERAAQRDALRAAASLVWAVPSFRRRTSSRLPCRARHSSSTAPSASPTSAATTC